MPRDRLNRYIVRAAGVSRRTADEIIRNGRVAVDGVPVTDPGHFVDPRTEEIRLDGNTLVALDEEKIYVMAFKPDAVVTTMRDKEGRRTAANLVGDLAARVFPVGRLDYHTTGLLLFTNDGELSYKLTHPKFGVEKTYVAKVQGVPTPGKLKVLARGIDLDGEMTNPATLRFVEAKEGKAWVSIRIAEGRYHQVRRMFEAIGHRVMKLKRVAVGPVELSDVEPGEWRYLTPQEVRDLHAYVERKEKEVAEAPKRIAERRGQDRPHPPRKKRFYPDRRPTEKRKTDATPAAGPPPQGERRGPRQPKPAWKKPSRRPSPGGRR